ncbi:cytochrome c oxidase assembly protein [Candidatus Poriferisodalis sp.]|uniref:cytochrome c oxidase assembly protein n=1 Tax=Candidatus Poriferisodalis sp. TaxID=3101277 RepID=UPI003B026763
MRFWCSALQEPWTWAWRAYPGVWAATAAIAVPYVFARHRIRRTHALPLEEATVALWRRQTWFFGAGVMAFWLASDWPLGVLGAGYLASAHMAQFMLYTLVAAPLLVLGTPEPMARRILAKLRLYRFMTRLTHPVCAGLAFNGCLVATHSPWATDTLRANQFGSFVMDVVWLTSGVVVWLPICSPLIEHRLRAYPGKMVYLFLALGVVPAVPAGFLTFAGFPLYATYELAPRFYGLDAATDQQMAGLIMKLGGIPIVWGAIIAMMLRWADESRAEARGALPAVPPAPGKRVEAKRSGPAGD